MKRDREYWGRKMRKLRNRTRKMRVKCDWLALDPLCETEANTWCPLEYTCVDLVINIDLATETKKALTYLKQSMQKSIQMMAYANCRCVAPAPQPVSKVQHNQVIVLQGDYFHSDT